MERLEPNIAGLERSLPDAFAEALNAVPDAVIVSSSDGQIIFGNRQAETLFGYTPAELVGQSIESLVPERFRGSHPQRRVMYVAAPRVRPMGSGLDLHALRKDGTEIPVEISLSPVSYGSETAIIASIRDVTARRQLEDERRRALKQVQAIQAFTDTALGSLAVEELIPHLLQRVRDALEADTTAILLLDETTEFLMARWALGLEEEVEQHVRVPVGAGFAGRIAAERKPVVVDDIEAIETVNPVLREKGIRSLLGVPLLLEDRLLGVLHVGTLARRQFTHDEALLLQLVANRTALALDRARLYEEAREAVRIRNEFLSAISHDLGNPVAAIRLESRHLVEVLADARSEDVREGLAQIEGTANRMWRQVEELLDLARLQVGRALELNWRSRDLVALVRELASAEQATTAQHTVRVETDVPTLIGEWDTTRLERVITNLLSNAVKYSPAGGVISIGIGVESIQGTSAASRCAVIRVQDEGIGIPAQDLPHVAEQFFRASNVRGRFAGTGIGLAGASRIIEAHGGEMIVESTEGAGTTVILRLPIEEDSEEQE